MTEINLHPTVTIDQLKKLAVAGYAEEAIVVINITIRSTSSHAGTMLKCKVLFQDTKNRPFIPYELTERIWNKIGLDPIYEIDVAEEAVR